MSCCVQFQQQRAGITDQERVENIYFVWQHMVTDSLGCEVGIIAFPKKMFVNSNSENGWGGIDGLVIPCVHMDDT